MTEQQKELEAAILKFWDNDGTNMIPALMSTACKMTMNRHGLNQKEAAKILIIQIQTNFMDLKPEEIDTTRPA